MSFTSFTEGGGGGGGKKKLMIINVSGLGVKS